MEIAGRKRGDASVRVHIEPAFLHQVKSQFPVFDWGMVQLADEADRDLIATGAGNGKPVEIELDDLGVADGLRFHPIRGGPDLPVAARKLTIPQPREIEIYWSAR